MKKRVLGAFLLVALTAACTPPGAGGGAENKFSDNFLRQNLIPGRTTVAEVRNIYGTPHSMDKGMSGPTEYVYERSANNAMGSAGSLMGLVPIVGGYMGTASSVASSSSHTSSLDLYIEFKDGLVSSYRTYAH